MGYIKEVPCRSSGQQKDPRESSTREWLLLIVRKRGEFIDTRGQGNNDLYDCYHHAFRIARSWEPLPLSRRDPGWIAKFNPCRLPKHLCARHQYGWGIRRNPEGSLHRFCRPDVERGWIRDWCVDGSKLALTPCSSSLIRRVLAGNIFILTILGAAYWFFTTRTQRGRVTHQNIKAKLKD